MTLKAILTSGYPLSEKRVRLAELFWTTAARHLPKKLAYWSFIHSGVKNILPNEEVPAVPYTVVLQRLSK